MKAIITQINSVNILPSDTDSIVRGNATFLIHSDGEFIFDVFECSGLSKVKYSDSLQKLHDQKGKSLEIVGVSEQKHAVKVSESSITFLTVESPHAIVRWLPLNFETDEGTGYLKFSAGDLMYSSKFKNMQIEFQPVQSSKRTKSSVDTVKYTLYVSNDSDLLDYTAQCQGAETEKVLVVPLTDIEFKNLKE